LTTAYLFERCGLKYAEKDLLEELLLPLLSNPDTSLDQEEDLILILLHNNNNLNLVRLTSTNRIIKLLPSLATLALVATKLPN
jgi:vesicle coat complex subunit